MSTPLLWEELLALPAEEQARILAESEPAIRTVCGWCDAVIVDGPLNADGLESTGICEPCGAACRGRR